MVEAREAFSRSWFSARGARAQAASLCERLQGRLKGERGVFITLTYRREEWAGTRELYRASSEDRHVRRFIAGLSAYLGESLNGRWIRKLEFQEGGWVHWHLIILGVSRIEHADLSELWGYGFVWVSRMSERRIRYFGKYLAKDGGGVPAWVYAEPVRSVKVVASSPGFWRNERVRVHEPSDRIRLRGVYRSIGQSVDEAERWTILRDDRHRHTRVRKRLWELVGLATHVVAGQRPGWVGLVGVRPDGTARPRYRWGVLLGVEDGGARRGSGGLPLHLTEKPNPPNAEKYPGWLGDYFRWVDDVERGVAA